MVSCWEGEADYLEVRLSHMMAHQHYRNMKRVLVIDSREEVVGTVALRTRQYVQKDVSESFMTILHGLRDKGLIDEWSFVDYSQEYVKKVRRAAKWKSNFTTTMSLTGQKGNLVYYFMLDTCLTTYCAHFDLDVVIWAKDEHSWIREGIALLEASPDTLEVQPPTPGCSATKGLVSSVTTCDSSLDQSAGHRLENDAYFVTARYYLMHNDRYKQLLRGLKKIPLTTCGGNYHWERLVSCAACKLGWTRIDMISSSMSSIAHFPTNAHPKVLDAILTQCVDKGTFLAEENGFDAQDYTAWEQHECMGQNGMTSLHKVAACVHYSFHNKIQKEEQNCTALKVGAASSICVNSTGVA